MTLADDAHPSRPCSHPTDAPPTAPSA